MPVAVTCAVLPTVRVLAEPVRLKPCRVAVGVVVLDVLDEPPPQALSSARRIRVIAV